MTRLFIIIVLLYVVCNLTKRVDKLENNSPKSTSNHYLNPYDKDTTIITKVEE